MSIKTITNGFGKSLSTLDSDVQFGKGVVGSDLNSTASDVLKLNSTFSDTISNLGGDDTSVDYKNVDASPTYPSDSDYDYGNESGGNIILTYPETLSNITLNPAHINFQFYKRDSQEMLTSINLPMPDNITNPSTINWDTNINLGMMGDAVVKSLKAVQSGTASQDSIESSLGAIAERAKSLAFYNGVSKAVETASLGTNNLSGEALMGQVAGKVPNPYRSVLFRGVDFRQFEFTFNLVPFSESDCDLIDSIIKRFRSHSYPEFSGEKMFFEYPDECLITYMWESDANKWLNNFKRAVCTGIDVNFAPNGQWSSIRNGFPNMIRLTTKWSEVEIITKADIVNDNNNGQRS